MKKITLKGARVSAGYTQQELAKQMNISRQAIIGWETNKTRIRSPQLYMFCQICGFSPDDIFLPDKSTKSIQMDKTES